MIGKQLMIALKAAEEENKSSVVNVIDLFLQTMEEIVLH